MPHGREGGRREVVPKFWGQGRTSRWLPRQVSLIRIKQAIEQDRGSSPHDANGWYMRTSERQRVYANVCNITGQAPDRFGPRTGPARLWLIHGCPSRFHSPAPPVS